MDSKTAEPTPPKGSPLRAHDYQTRDSGQRVNFDSGMVRDTEAGKARFDLLVPLGVPYRAQMLTRFAALMARGAEKYNARNWELARGEAELLRYRSSAFRHLIQWMTGGQSDNDPEDHAAAVMFNILAGETVRYKLDEALIAEAFPDPDEAFITFGHLDARDILEERESMGNLLNALNCYNRDPKGICLGHSHSSSPTGVIYHPPLGDGE